MNNNTKRKKNARKKTRNPKLQSNYQQPNQQMQQANPNQQPNRPRPTKQQPSPNKKNTNKPTKSKKKSKFTKKFSELTPKEREIYLKRKQIKMRNEQRKLRKAQVKKRNNSKYNPNVPYDNRNYQNNNNRKIRRHKKRHKKNYTLYYIILFIISSITLYSLSTTVWFEIEEITVVGDINITHEEIILTSGIQMFENLVKLSEKDVSARIRNNYITIESVELNKKFPNKVEIEVELAKPKALIYYDRMYYTLSESNRIIAFDSKDDYKDETITNFIATDLEDMDLGDYLQDVDFDLLEDIDRLMVAIEENDFYEVDYVDIKSENDIKFYVDNIYEIKAGGFTEISYKLHCAKSIIEFQNNIEDTQVGVIDVSKDDGQYYFKPALNIKPSL